MSTRHLGSRPRLSDTAYEELRDQIVRTALQPGSRIAENEFVERLGVSRTPIREALLRLADEGLVEIIPQSGIYVAPVKLAAVIEAQFIREHLECAVVREVATSLDPAGLGSLRAALMVQESAHEAGDRDRFFALDERFHEQLCEIARREGVWRVIKHSKPHLDRVRWLSLPVADHIARLITQHRAVVDAIARHDPDMAEAAMRAHLREVYKTIEQLRLRDADQEARALAH